MKTNLITRENLLKIINSKVMLEQFYNELNKETQSTDWLEKAIWYSLRDYQTNLALLQSKGEDDFKLFDREKS